LTDRRTKTTSNGNGRTEAQDRSLAGPPVRSETGEGRRAHSIAGRVEAICFDLDETLLDSHVAWRKGFVSAFEAEALPLYPSLAAVPDIYLALQPFFRAEVEALGGSWGPSVVRDAIRKFIREHATHDDACADRTYEAYLDIWPRHIELFDDAVAALDATSAGRRVAVITNGPSKEQRLKLERTGLMDRFEVIAISGEVGHEKPAAEIFAHTLSSLGIGPEAALHIGDSLHYDVAGARAAGLTAVWLNRGGLERDPSAAEPDHEVADLQTFVALLD
jgi:putative hydrolase of the HAD superfamily